MLFLRYHGIHNVRGTIYIEIILKKSIQSVFYNCYIYLIILHTILRIKFPIIFL